MIQTAKILVTIITRNSFLKDLLINSFNYVIIIIPVYVICNCLFRQFN